ncbi:MAG: cbb3-type cytochrome c oxidase N-terminal domain-containing protein [Calditrichota bacterium]
MAKNKPTLAELDKNLMSHEYDGIRELDNNLPPWWIALFIGSIVWAVGYMWYYHVIIEDGGQVAAYHLEMKAAEQAKVEYLQEKARADFLAEINNTGKAAAAKGSLLEAGEKIWVANCVTCHAADGGGGIGPNMTDDYWIHGGDKTSIATTIRVGVPAKGMISWEPILSPDQIDQVSEFILSLQGTTPANPKAPEGDKL